MAGTRLSGLMSGMDTDSIIEQLMESRKKKVEIKNVIRLEFIQKICISYIE